MIKHTITPQGVIPANLYLIDSHKVSKKKFRSELNQIHALHPKSEVWNRGYTQMCLEWACHNALYACHIARERTKDCDLNYPQNIFVRAAYTIMGCIVWLFIK